MDAPSLQSQMLDDYKSCVRTFNNIQAKDIRVEKKSSLQIRKLSPELPIQSLAGPIYGYLQCLFGPGTEVRVNLSDTGIQGLDLIRPCDPAFSFATLSGGAKEQVAATTRLALAEILATDHDGSLPILFDDAFAYTAPIRIQSLQRMLDLAALRGLQIIVLTCAPNDYSTFGSGKTRI